MFTIHGLLRRPDGSIITGERVRFAQLAGVGDGATGDTTWAGMSKIAVTDDAGRFTVQLTPETQFQVSCQHAYFKSFIFTTGADGGELFLDDVVALGAGAVIPPPVIPIPPHGHPEYATDEDLANGLAGKTGKTDPRLSDARPIVGTIPGLVGDGVADDTAAIQAAINAVRDAVAAGTAKSNQLILPEGVYRITSTITLHPYVRLAFKGFSRFVWEGGAGACLYIAPRSTDPVPPYPGLTKQEHLAGVLAGALGAGGLSIRNASGTTAGAIGVEVGPRTDTGPYRPLARYTISDIAVSGFDRFGVLINNYQNYIVNIARFHIEDNAVAVRWGALTGSGANSGENIRLVDCTIAGGGTYPGTVGIHVAAPGGIHVRGCSMDYLSTGIHFTAGYSRVAMDTCHIEGVNGSSYSEPVAGQGLVKFAPSTGRAGAHFSNCSIMLRSTLPLFIGTNGSVYGEVIPATYSLAVEGDRPGDTSWWVEPGVDARLDVQIFTERRHAGKGSNRLPCPNFANETVGLAAGDLADWAVGKSAGVTVEVIDEVTVHGTKACRVTVPNGGYVTLTSKQFLPVRTDGDRWGTAVLKPDAAGAKLQMRATYSDAAGANSITRGWIESHNTNIIPAGEYRVPAYVTQLADPNVAGQRAWVKPAYQISNQSGAPRTVTLPYLYFGP